MPPVGKYNAGQKLVFWSAAICLVVLLVTGFMFWQPWFADAFPIVVRRIAVAAARVRRDGADPDHHRPHLRGDLGQGLGAGDDARHRHRGLGALPPPALVAPDPRQVSRRSDLSRPRHSLCAGRDRRPRRRRDSVPAPARARAPPSASARCACASCAPAMRWATSWFHRRGRAGAAARCSPASPTVALPSPEQIERAANGRRAAARRHRLAARSALDRAAARRCSARLDARLADGPARAARARPCAAATTPTSSSRPTAC